MNKKTIIMVIMMTSKRVFELIYDSEVAQHLAPIERKYYGLIRRTIEQQLSHEPDVEIRNRKALLRPIAFEATWEIRFSPANRFRVFYEIDFMQCEVYILAIGVKRANRLLIGEEEFEL